MPTTGRFYLVQINDVYLTKNGLSSGKPCQTVIPNLELLKPAARIQVIKSLDFSPSWQFSGETDVQVHGIDLDISFKEMEQSVWDSIVTIVNAFITGSASITLSITGGVHGDFSGLDVGPAEKPITFPSDYHLTRVLDGAFHFITT